MYGGINSNCNNNHGWMLAVAKWFWWPKKSSQKQTSVAPPSPRFLSRCTHRKAAETLKVPNNMKQVLICLSQRTFKLKFVDATTSSIPSHFDALPSLLSRAGITHLSWRWSLGIWFSSTTSGVRSGKLPAIGAPSPSLLVWTRSLLKPLAPPELIPNRTGCAACSCCWHGVRSCSQKAPPLFQSSSLWTSVIYYILS